MFARSIYGILFLFDCFHFAHGSSLIAQLVKNPPAMQESPVPGLGRSAGEGKKLPKPVFWPGEFHGLYSPWDCKESQTTEQLSLLFSMEITLLLYLEIQIKLPQYLARGRYIMNGSF